MSNPDLGNISTANEIDLSVRGRKSGQEISRTVWFVHEDNRLYYNAPLFHIYICFIFCCARS